MDCLQLIFVFIEFIEDSISWLSKSRCSLIFFSLGLLLPLSSSSPLSESSHTLLNRSATESRFGFPYEKGLPPGEKTTIPNSALQSVANSLAFLNKPVLRLEKVTCLVFMS